MNFIKWTSIENSYRDKYINGFLEYYPELANERFVITEKIDGSNFHWALFPDGQIKCGSRNNYLDTKGSFQGAQIVDLYREHEELLLELSMWCVGNDESIRLYGELFGQGIQKRVDYGPQKQLLYFGMMIADDWVSFKELQNFIDVDYLVPILSLTDTLQEALDYEIEFNTLLSDKEDNLAEGIVITTYDKVYLDQNGSPFILKKKNEKFGEGKVKTAKPVDTEVYALNAAFREYVNKNRVLSVFSKEGEIGSPKEIGKYIKLIMADAVEDFQGDYMEEISQMTTAQLKQVYNVGSIVANMLKEYL